MFKQNKLYRHENMRTCAFEVLTCYYVKEKNIWKLKVGWWNISSVRLPFYMNLTQRIAIKANDYKNWKEMDYYDFGPKPIHTHHGE